MEAAFQRRGMSIAVRMITPDDYDSFRALRLESLRLLPDCFAADPVQEEAMPKDQWLSRLASAASFGGFVDDTLSGMVVFSRPSRPKLAHTGDIGAMYVRSSAQGTGLADALMTTLLKHASTVVEQVQLTVNAENARAIKFYERHGFREIGRIPRSLHVDDRYYDDMLMFRSVSSAA
jgi:ribosomal protein S18 acetylase RimI-like enzyme